MKKKHYSNLLFFMLLIITLSSGYKLHGQTDTIPKVIISEWRGTGVHRNYAEITNIGDTAVNLGSFDVGALVGWTNAYRHVCGVDGCYQSRLPEYTLQPGESYLIATVNDYWDENYDPMNGEDLAVFTQRDIRKEVDFPIFRHEIGLAGDSVSVYANVLNCNGNMGWYLEYHYPSGDSIVVDAVNNSIQANGRILAQPSDVAGVINGTKFHILVRKASVTRGNTDWEQSRGIDAEDSEWIVIPFQSDDVNPNHKFFTTLKYHGNAQLNESTFKSDVIDIDISNGTLEVPWGIYRDSIMFEFDLGKGLAWHFYKSPVQEDSLYTSVRTGDTLVMWATGNTLQEVQFAITVKAPANDVNHVLPRYRRTEEVNARNERIVRYTKLFGVTENQSGMDSITDVDFGLRIDTLFKYLEKPSNAEWEVLWVDANERPDIKRGDILKITAENGDIKEYYIAADSIPEPGHNANLRAITWPDVPETIMLSPEWGGDITIPRFNRGIFSYQFTVPYGQSIPALQVFPEDINAQISIKRATNLRGSMEDRTTLITVTAEDNKTIEKYSVLFEEEVPSIFVQPFSADPIITQLGFKISWFNNFCEISNPGNQPLDLSRYMIAENRQQPIYTPADVIRYNSEVYADRFTRYVFGYDYVSETDWAAKPGHLVIDNQIDPILEPGECFVIAFARANGPDFAGMLEYSDLLFDNATMELESIEGLDAKILKSADLGYHMFSRAGGIWNDIITMFKITNDSILEGTKGIGDPEDFQLIEIFGDYTGAAWNIDGIHNEIKQIQGVYRKSQFWDPDTVPNYSFGATPEESQWIYRDNDMMLEQGYEWPYYAWYVAEGMGSHSFDPITIYRSTVSSLEYVVSDGYRSPQTIIGVLTETSVQSFLDNIIKADPGQTFKVISGDNSDELEMNVKVSDKDTLVVLSADSVNTTKYAITVSEGGLDNDAVLEAKAGSGYTIEIEGDMGSIMGIPQGTMVKDVLEKVEKPSTAKLYIIDHNDNLVSLKKFNYDSVFVETPASHLIYFEVVAQDNKTKITYQLVLDLPPDDVFLMSEMYSVDQVLTLVSGIPDGTRVPKLFENIYTSKGASACLVDKAGNERTAGDVAYDDKILVMSEDSAVIKTYYLRFLEQATGTEAYVISKTPLMVIDQIEFLINGVVENTPVADFLSNLIPAEGASMLLVDADGNEVTSGNVEDVHRLKVTSADGAMIVFYNIDIEVIIGGKILNVEGISAYPNPTSGEIFITGLRSNCMLKIYSITGELRKAYASKQIERGTISLDDQPDGIYFIQVEADGYILKTLKVIKR
jgi:hypothetical protein